MQRTEKVQVIISDALRGSRKLKITFRRDADRGDINYLLGMINQGGVTIPAGDKMALMAVSMSGDWGANRNRQTVVTLTEVFDCDWFEGRLLRALERVELVGPRPKPMLEPVNCKTCKMVLLTADGCMYNCDCDISEIVADLIEMGYAEGEMDQPTGLIVLIRPNGSPVRQELFMEELERALLS